MIELEKSICKIEVERECGGLSRGTGFFIANDIILTCNHVITNNSVKIEIFKCNNQKEIELTATIIDKCEDCDYALLKLNETFSNVHFLELCKSEIIEEEPILTFGYPDDEQGQKIGERLVGFISRFIEDSTDTIHDIILDIKDFAHDTKYSAFSGSPVINEYRQVTSILKYQGVRSLSSVSVKKAITFLEKNKINVKPDKLQSFDFYNDVFNLYPENIKIDCEANAMNIIQSRKPADIINVLEGNLFYPKVNKSVSEMIIELRQKKDLNDSLWKGWIKLLTYVEIIKGNSSNLNHIEFNLNEIDVRILYGDNISTNQKITVPLKLSFYFTTGKSYFQIARSFLPIKTNQKENTCSIFNSNDENYFLQKFTSSNKKKIIPNISGDIGSSFKVEERINFGVLSLEALSSEMVNSETIEEASNNIEKLFIDAIK
jgi:hypothetical protein